MARTALYPALTPRATGMLSTDSAHRVYWEESGAPDGIPVCFLHGGPGAGTAPGQRRFFDPQFYRIILHDQRGAGRSVPYGDITDNHTDALIADMERLRRHLKIDRWVLFGGSWGSTLALAYAIRHPGRTMGLILRGVFLARERERDWFLHGMGRFFPEARAEFVNALPVDERQDVFESYYRRLCDPDPAIHGPAARAWGRYEGQCSTLLPGAQGAAGRSGNGGGSGSRSESSSGGGGGGVGMLALARLEAHYFRNRFFLAEGALLEGAKGLRHLPGSIVQGRYDMVCPPVSAHELATIWDKADFVMVPDAGHSANEPGLTAALVGATERLKKILS